MDLNSATQTPTANPVGSLPNQPQQVNPMQQPSATQPSKGSKKWLKVLLVLIFLALISAGGFIAYKYYFTPSATYNAGVYKEPQTATKVTPTPSGYQTNPSDTSNQSLDADTSQIDKNMTNINSDLNNVDQSTTDQQTNLQ